MHPSKQDAKDALAYLYRSCDSIKANGARHRQFNQCADVLFAFINKSPDQVPEKKDETPELINESQKENLVPSSSSPINDAEDEIM